MLVEMQYTTNECQRLDYRKAAGVTGTENWLGTSTMLLPVTFNIYERDKYSLSVVTGTCKAVKSVGYTSEN